MKHLFSYAFIATLFYISCSNQPVNPNSKITLADTNTVLVGGGCDGCEAIYESPVPLKKLQFIDTLPDYFEAGPKLMISGIIYKMDGKTPAANTVLYIYHTDQTGHYSKKGNEKGWGKRHGYIRGWVKTNEKGEYKFYTLRPVAYPGNNIPAHIHAIIKEEDKNEYWIDDFLFDNDPLLTTAERKKQENRAGNGILTIENINGMQVAERNIVLGLNIPNYPKQENSAYHSGLSIGEYCPAFDPQFVSGPDKGKRKCPMCSYGYGQGVLLFWNNKEDALWLLLKRLDNEIAAKGFNKIRVFAIYTNGAHENLSITEGWLTNKAMLYRLLNCAVAFIPAEELEKVENTYKINKDPAIRNTIFIYSKRKIIDKFVNYESDDIKELTKKL